MRNAFVSLVLLSAGCFVDAFAPKGGGGSSSTEGAGATGATSSGGNGVGASGGQSTGGTSSGGSGGAGGGGASAGGGGSDPSGGGGAGGASCDNHFLRFTGGAAARIPDASANEANDFAFGARLRVGSHPGFSESGTQRAGVFGNFNVTELKGWRVLVVEDGANTVLIAAEVYVNGTPCFVWSAPLMTPTSWVGVRASYKRGGADPSDLRLFLDDQEEAVANCGDADTPTFTQDVRFGANVGNDLSYVGDIDDVYFKDKKAAWAACYPDTHLRFDFETDLEVADGIASDCDDAVVMVLDTVKTPQLACEP
jgi:hypothetical protein